MNSVPPRHSEYYSSSSSAETPLIDPFSSYEPQDNVWDFERDDIENKLALRYQKTRLPWRFQRKPLFWHCSLCGHRIETRERHCHCSECGNFDLCELCWEKGLGRHVHAPNGSESETEGEHHDVDDASISWNFVHVVTEPDWKFGERLRNPFAGLTYAEALLRVFQHYRDRILIATRPEASTENLVWFSYEQIHRTSVRIAMSLRKLQLRETEDGLCFVAILTGIRVSVPCVWFGCGLSSCAAFVPIQRTLNCREMREIVDNYGIRIVFTEQQHFEKIREVFDEKRSDSCLFIVVLLDDDLDVLAEATCSFERLGARNQLDSADERIQVFTLAQFLSIGEELEEDEEGVLSFTILPQDSNSPAAVIHTSGSRSPKGVVFSTLTWQTEFQFPRTDRHLVSLVYAPLSHLSGIHFVHSAFFNGGRVGTLCDSDLANIFDDFRIIRPTYMSAFPRLFQMVFDIFQRRCSANSGGCCTRDWKQEVYEGMREPFGDRVTTVRIGSAPCTRQLIRFIRRLCRTPINEGYGMTEVGAIATDGRFRKGVRFRILPCPELGYTPEDKPHPRGELLVQTKRSQSSQVQLDNVGFFHTGDVVELREDNRIRIIDRRSNVVKLSQGEFISLESVEAVFETSPSLSQVALFPSPSRTCFVAIVYVSAEGTSEMTPMNVIEEMRRIGQQQKLAVWAIPTKCLLAPFELPLTSLKKKRRKRIEEHFQTQLTTLFAESCGQMNESPSSFRSCLKELLCVAELDLEALWEDAGGDSLRGVQLMSALQSVGISLSYHEVRIMTIGKILYLGENRSTKELALSASTEWVSVEEELLRMRELITSLSSERDHSNVLISLPCAIFLTGATGFVGGFVLRSLMQSFSKEMVKEVLCLVRQPSVIRLREKISDLPLHQDRVRIIIGDLEEDRFGLSEPDFADLAASTDLIIHTAAQVNHLLSYEDLYKANVQSVFPIVRLSRGRKPIINVSSLSVFSSRKNLEISQQHHPHSRGYSASKWASDVLFSEIPHCLTLRPPLIFGCNPADWLCRSIVSMLMTGTAPSENSNSLVPLNMISVESFSCLIVRFITGIIENSYSFFYESVNLAFENIPIKSLFKFIARFHREELQSRGAVLQRIPFSDWIGTMKSTPMGPFVSRWQVQGCLGPRSRRLTPLLLEEKPDGDSFATFRKLTYDEFRAIVAELLAGMTVESI